MDNYNSIPDTQKHIQRVSFFLTNIILEVMNRMQGHDASKLLSPEKELFDLYTPKLKGSTYGSEEYKTFLKEMDEAIKHHYSTNRHHPEYHKDGIEEMNLIDLIEMICDWKAATERHTNGDIEKSILINKERFNISDQLVKILQNTVRSSYFKGDSK